MDKSLHEIPEQTTADDDFIDSSNIDFLPDADKEKDVFRTKVHYFSLSYVLEDKIILFDCYNFSH